MKVEQDINETIELESELDSENESNKTLKHFIIKYFIIINIAIATILEIINVVDSYLYFGCDMYPLIHYYITFSVLGGVGGVVYSFFTKVKVEIIHIIILIVLIIGLIYYCNLEYSQAQVNHKPIIYLYPEEETNIKVLLENPDLLTCTYPKYDDSTGWNVVAEPNGDLKYEDKELYALYWEGDSKNKKRIRDDGFVVKGSDIAKFLEEKLYLLGLSDREAEEFIVYWLPRMEKNEYNYIRFETMEEINDNMPLNIEPKPDTTIRVMMDWCEIKGEKKVEELKKSIKQQDLPQIERKGYVAVEWGGSEI